MDLTGLRKWFFNNASKAANAFWSLKGDGKYRGNNLEISEVSPSFQALEELIIDLNNNGVRNFEVTFKATKTDPSKLVYPIQAAYASKAGGGGIAGIGGIGEILRMQAQLTESKLETIRAEHKADIERRDAQLKAKEAESELETRIWQLENESKNTFEKWMDKIEDSPRLQGFLQPLVTGFAQSMFTPVNIAGLPDGAAVPAPVIAESSEPSEEESGGFDFNQIVNSVAYMQKAGIKNPDDKLYKIAYVAAANAELFEQNYLQIEEAYNMLTSQNPKSDE